MQAVGLSRDSSKNVIPLRVRGPVFGETLEGRPIVTSTASPEEPVVKVLGIGYREGERG